MSATMDPRLANRRRSVLEAAARRRLGRWVAVLVATAVVGSGAWFVYQSPYLTVREVSVDGQVHSQVQTAMSEAGFAMGMPTINVNAEAMQSALLRDPWVASVSVSVTWPGSVSILLIERVAAAWIKSPSGWMMVSLSGSVLVTAEEPSTELPRISVGSPDRDPGLFLGDVEMAAIEFLTVLPENLRRSAVVTGTIESLEANVAGHQVILGYGDDMAAKSRATVAVLEAGQREGAVIIVISPERPAVKSKSVLEVRREVLGGESSPG